MAQTSVDDADDDSDVCRWLRRLSMTQTMTQMSVDGSDDDSDVCRWLRRLSMMQTLVDDSDVGR